MAQNSRSKAKLVLGAPNGNAKHQLGEGIVPTNDISSNTRLVVRPMESTDKGTFAKNIAMTHSQPNNPLHGLTLETILTRLVEHYGWEALGQQINIKCFNHEPSIKSSLKFLRSTPWARKQVEALYLRLVEGQH